VQRNPQLRRWSSRRGSIGPGVFRLSPEAEAS